MKSANKLFSPFSLDLMQQEYVSNIIRSDSRINYSMKDRFVYEKRYNKMFDGHDTKATILLKQLAVYGAGDFLLNLYKSEVTGFTVYKIDGKHLRIHLCGGTDTLKIYTVLVHIDGTFIFL